MYLRMIGHDVRRSPAGGVLLNWFDVTACAFAAAYGLPACLVCLWAWALDASATRPRLAWVR